MILGFIIDKLYPISTADDHTNQPAQCHRMKLNAQQLFGFLLPEGDVSLN